jgi:alpha-beta hydrolase superfamily lysophospholipase
VTRKRERDLMRIGQSVSERRGQAGRRALRCLALVGAALVCATVLLTGCNGSVDDEAPAPKASGPTIETTEGAATPYGTGAGKVWVLRPRHGEVKSVVVYLHGYGAYLPFEWHLQWMDHLLANGSAVIFPALQAGGTGDEADDAWVIMPLNLEDGLRTGFRALDYHDEPIAAAGFSVGATLAFVYAARADEWHVPAPQAVYSIFPVHPYLIDVGLDLSAVKQTPTLILAGENDDVVGQDGAKKLMELLTGLPAGLKELRLIRKTDAIFADHESPTLVERPITRETFWKPLDELVDKARG